MARVRSCIQVATITAAALLAACSRSDQTAAPASDAAPPAADTATASVSTATPPGEISIPGTAVFPESLTSTPDGTLYIGSVGQSQILRAAPGANAAEVFIQPGTGGMKQIFGVFADARTNLLWACSNQLAAGPPGAAPPGPSALHSFDLATGAAKASFPLPAGGMCNDIATYPSGDVFITDTAGMQVLRLPNGGGALEPWSPPNAFGPPGGVLDGIAVVGDRVIVNTLATNKLFGVKVLVDGKSGEVKELTLSAPLSGPDGMRTYGNDGVLVTDNTGKIQHVTINADAATVRTVKDGLEGPVSVTAVGKTGYALEGQLAIMFAGPGGNAPAEKPYRAVVFQLP